MFRGTIQGSVTVPGVSVEDWRIELAGPVLGETTTSADGSFQFTDLPLGAYSVRVLDIPPEVTFEQDQLFATLTQTERIVEVEFVGEREAEGDIEASVSAEGEPVADVTVEISGPTSASQLTPASGVVVFEEVPTGSYTVTIRGIPSGYAFATTAQSVTLGEHGATASVSFNGSVVRTASIAGKVTVDGVGLAGAKVTIDGPEGTSSAQTGSSGNYSFTGLRGGTYTVTLSGFDPDLYAFNVTQVERQVPAGGSVVADFMGTAAERP